MRRKIRLRESELRRMISESVKRVLSESLEGTDEIEDAITNAASIIADAYHSQNGRQDVTDDHDDAWYELQEDLREAMLNAALGILNSNYYATLYN